MPDLVTAEEIIRQSQQGVSVRPFLIRGDDGHTYFVKGYSRAGGPGLVSEVLAAELGSRLGLPIPPWRFMCIPDDLIEMSTLPNITDLSGGTAFASQMVENASEIQWKYVSKLPIELRNKVLLFDWWLQNADRCLGPLGGNVNLLLNASGELAVIDHNAAFEGNLTVAEFHKYHVFRDSRGFHDLATRPAYCKLLDDALADWAAITAILPDEWIYRDADHVDESEPTLTERLRMLERYRDDHFWGQI